MPTPKGNTNTKHTDVEECLDNTLFKDDANIELFEDAHCSGADKTQLIGLRFRDLQVNQGATIADARIFVTAVGGGGANGNLLRILVRGIDDNNVGRFMDDTRIPSNVPWTSESVTWTTSAAWSNGQVLDFPVTELVQHIVNIATWSSGNSIGFILQKEYASDTGIRVIKSYDGGDAPWLQVTWSTNAPTVPTRVPSKAPSTSPTIAPSTNPSATPSNAPSLAPTRVPTATPSASPTMAPSASPTSAPSSHPTVPSAAPTSQAPTMAPAGPSYSPTFGPTPEPTRAPRIMTVAEEAGYCPLPTSPTDNVTGLSCLNGVCDAQSVCHCTPESLMVWDTVWLYERRACVLPSPMIRPMYVVLIVVTACAAVWTLVQGVRATGVPRLLLLLCSLGDVLLTVCHIVSYTMEGIRVGPASGILFTLAGLCFVILGLHAVRSLLGPLYAFAQRDISRYMRVLYLLNALNWGLEFALSVMAASEPPVSDTHRRVMGSLFGVIAAHALWMTFVVAVSAYRIGRECRRLANAVPVHTSPSSSVSPSQGGGGSQMTSYQDRITKVLNALGLLFFSEFTGACLVAGLYYSYGGILPFQWLFYWLSCFAVFPMVSAATLRYAQLRDTPVQRFRVLDADGTPTRHRKPAGSFETISQSSAGAGPRAADSGASGRLHSVSVHSQAVPYRGGDPDV